MKDNTSSYNSSVYDARISNVLPYENEFDIVTAILSHHYYDLETREIAVKKCHRTLHI